MKTKVEKAFGSECKVHSLARASREGDRWRKHATITFPSLSNDSLLALLATSNKRLPGTSGLQYDKLFLGLTSLYDAGKDASVE